MNKTTKTCGVCDTAKSNAQFYKSPIDGSLLHICKNCCKKKFKEYEQITGKASAAAWLVLSELGVPYLSDIWKQVEMTMVNVSPSSDIIMTYLKFLNESGKIIHGFWESDVMLDMLIDIDVDRDTQNDEMDMEEQQRIWGRFLVDNALDVEAYEFLNETFKDYTENVLDIDANLEKRYRDLAKAELRKRKADESGDISEITKAQDSLKKILDMLKLSDFSSQEVDERKKFIDRLAWIIEETEPAELEDESTYKDIQGFEKIYDDWMRSMQNMCAGTKNYPEVPKAED